MDKCNPGPMTPFDELLSSPELQLIKLFIPYAPASGRQMLAIYIKFMELQKTIRLFRSREVSFHIRTSGTDNNASISEILAGFRPYLTPEMAEALDTFISLNDMINLMNMMNDGGDSETTGGSFDAMSMLSGMLSPDQQEMFRTYSDMFAQSADNTQKGDDTDERLDEPSGNENHGSGKTGTD